MYKSLTLAQLSDISHSMINEVLRRGEEWTSIERCLGRTRDLPFEPQPGAVYVAVDGRSTSAAFQVWEGALSQGRKAPFTPQEIGVKSNGERLSAHAACTDLAGGIHELVVSGGGNRHRVLRFYGLLRPAAALSQLWLKDDVGEIKILFPARVAKSDTQTRLLAIIDAPANLDMPEVKDGSFALSWCRRLAETGETLTDVTSRLLERYGHDASRFRPLHLRLPLPHKPQTPTSAPTPNPIRPFFRPVSS